MTVYERVEGLPLLLRSIAAERQDDFIKELLLCSARQIEALTRRVTHTRSEIMLDEIIEALETITRECETLEHTRARIDDLIVKIHQDKYAIAMAVSEAKAMMKERTK